MVFSSTYILRNLGQNPQKLIHVYAVNCVFIDGFEFA